MSTVGPVKTALRALFEATFDDAVQVTFGNRVNMSGSTRLVIGRVIGKTTPESLGTNRTVEEVYDVECEISLSSQGSVGDQEAVTLACLVLYEGAELAVQSFPGQNLGVPEVLYAGVEGNFELKEPPASETKGPINASYVFNVHVRAM
jgi:hypothetical protein